MAQLIHSEPICQQARYDIADAMRRHARETDLVGRAKPTGLVEALHLASTVPTCAENLEQAAEWVKALLRRAGIRKSHQGEALSVLNAYWRLAEHDTARGRYPAA